MRGKSVRTMHSKQYAMNNIEFRAPWAKSLKISTILGALITLALVIFVAIFIPRMTDTIRIGVASVPLLILVLAASGMVRGYTITQDEIVIKRLARPIKLSLSTLQAVEGHADAINDSLPLFANKGFCVYWGWYWNRSLGMLRVYATDPSRAVVLRYPHRRIVITPHDPQQFIMRARTLVNTQAHRV